MQYKIFENTTVLFKTVADLIQNLSISKAEENSYLNIAVSGGSTPKRLFEIMAQSPYAENIAWNNLRFFWVDERCVPPTDDDSNYKMTYEALLHHGFINQATIFRMQGENNPTAEAARYQELLQDLLPEVNGYPIFDLILLGMGEDGHTASIFPDNMALLTSEKAVAAAIHPASGQNRITLTGETINHAEQVLFLITGAGKASIIKEIKQQLPTASNYPANFINNNKGNTVFYLDKEAGELIV